jgi:pSer/pThr/pTyr-binding forkhead associated (FHA) protein
LEEGRVLVRDCGSKNGTFVNGQRLERDHELKGGDRLQVGSLEFEVQLTVSVSGKKKSKVHNVHEAAARMVETAAGEEPDISDWLNDDDGEEDQAPDTANLHDTKPVPIPAQTEPAPQEPAPEKKKAHISELRPASRKPPTLFDEEPEKKVTAESSRQAAADMLKQFFHRKP